jgi:hypothetical protein
LIEVEQPDAALLIPRDPAKLLQDYATRQRMIGTDDIYPAFPSSNIESDEI